MLKFFTLLTVGQTGISRKIASVSSTSLKEKYDLFAGVLVERLPVIAKEFNETEKEFQEYLWRVEFEKSLKSKHELQHENGLKQAELLKKGRMEVDLEESVTKQTAQDLEDSYVEELNKFQFSPLTTVDDINKNITSTNRCLREVLYLFVEHKLSSQNFLLLPQGPHFEGETLRQTADRVLREICGESMIVQFYGNAPCGFYKYKYPVSARNQSVGVKVFFFRSYLKSGNVDKALCKNYSWLKKEDFNEKLSLYTESVQKFLI